MKNKIILLLIGLLFTSCSNQSSYIYSYEEDAPSINEGQRQTSGEDPFDNIGLYKDPELKIDGKIDEQYYYPTGSGRLDVYLGGNENTYVYLYKGERAIYFIFEAFDDDISTLNVEDTNICTAQSDSVELYVDTYGVGGKKRGNNTYEFRMTAGGRVYSYLTGFVSKVFLDGTNNNHKDVDKAFYVEGYISYDVLGNDVNKNTPTSFAFARVTKTGNKGYVWHGKVDPQIPNNYEILYTDNKMYPLDKCPLDVELSGNILSTDGQPIPNVIISNNENSVFSDANGYYSLSLSNVKDDINLIYRKNSYLTYKKLVTKHELRLNHKMVLDQTLLSNQQETYKTTLKGKLLQRDNLTPISSGLVSINETSTYTDEQGNYSFLASCKGYENKIIYQANEFEEYNKTLNFEQIKINQITELDNVILDENKGSTLTFGDAKITGNAISRIVRNDKSFKIVLKTENDLTQEGTYFEVFIDTKSSAGFNKRDETDYRFDISYDNGIFDYTNYGNKKISLTNSKTSSGRINELYYVEVDFAYSDLDITSQDIIGLYFGFKYEYVWSGMYNNGKYIPAENPRNYYRLGLDSKIYRGSTNYIEDEVNKVFINQIGNYSNKLDALKYNVYYKKDNDGILLIFELLDNKNLLDQAHSFNIYYDMNYSKTKNNCDSSCGRIYLYPGSPVSCRSTYKNNGEEDLASMVYEESIDEDWTSFYDNKVFVKLSYSMLGGNKNNTIGLAIGMYNDEAGKNDWLKYNNTEPNCDKPNTFIKISSAGEISI